MRKGVWDGISLGLGKILLLIKKIFSSYIRKFRRDRLKRHIYIYDSRPPHIWLNIPFTIECRLWLAQKISEEKIEMSSSPVL
jgi:hypothetical protein